MMDHEDYIYYRDMAEKRIRMVKNSLYGYDTPLSEYVCVKGSALSDEKIEVLADQLIGIMVSHGAGYQTGISGARRKCLQLFIYLAIKAYGGRVQTFGDILDVADDMMRSHDSLEELILYETDWQPEDEEEYDIELIRRRYPRYGRGFFGSLDQSYKILTGHHIGHGLTERELKDIWDRYMETAKRSLGKYDDLYLEDEMRDLMEWSKRQTAVMEYIERQAHGESYEYEDEGWEHPYRILTEEEQMINWRKEMRKQYKWEVSLQNPEKFLEAYEEFRSLFFSIGIDRDGLEDAVIHFLCKEGRSGLTDNEKFLRVYIQLDNAYRTAGK